MQETSGSPGNRMIRKLERHRSPIIELRQYTLHEGERDTLIELFERALVSGQEITGISVIGQFLDLDDTDRFVWVRQFESMAARPHALSGFYDGPVWATHRVAANATMVDASNVLLLRPAEPGAEFNLEQASVASPDRPQTRGLVEAITLTLAPAAERSNDLAFFRNVVAPALALSGASILGYFRSETSPNNFPRLPIREGIDALVCFCGHQQWPVLNPDSAEARRRAIRLAAQAPGAIRAPEVLRLLPTPDSRLTGTGPACTAMADLTPRVA